MKTRYFIAPALALLALCMGSCEDGKTYSELLDEETEAVNLFLADQRVIDHIPADTVFETGPDAPYYRMDEDGNLYMQVVDPGTKGNMAKSNELLYFRFTRYRVATYNVADKTFGYSEGNDAVLGGNYSFRYGNYEITSSYNYGTGIQVPLNYLPVDCRVNIVVKSEYGMPSEQSAVIPWLYQMRYYRPKS